MFDPIAFRSQFPLFAHPENQGLVYLDNAATTQRPQRVIDAMVDFYSRYNANTHRSSHRLARAATAMVESVREQAAQFLSVTTDEVVFVRGATEAINLLTYGLSASWDAGDEVVLSAAEHHANLVPWLLLSQRKGVKLRFIPLIDGRPDWSALTSLVNERTKLVSLTAASNALGWLAPLDQLRAQLPASCPLLLDASQWLAHREAQPLTQVADFIVSSAHKWYGPTGIGLLWGRKSRLDALPAWQGGGEMIRQVTLEHVDIAPAPHRFEAGTSSLAAIAGLGGCFDFWSEQARPAMQNYETMLCRYLHTELACLSSQRPLRLISSAPANVGIAAFVPSSSSALSAADIGAWLDGRDIAVRVGHHCAEPLANLYAEGPSVRISLAAYNTRADIDALITALRDAPWGNPSDASKRFKALQQDDLHGLHISEFAGLGSWQARYKRLIQWGQRILPKPEIRTVANRVSGCETEVWLCVQRDAHGRRQFLVDSDSNVIKGLAALLLVQVANLSDSELQRFSPDAMVETAGLQRYLSASRRGGVRALLQAMQQAVDV